MSMMINTQSNTTSYQLTGLKPFTNYTVTVAGINSANTGPYSGELIIRTAEDSEYTLLIICNNPEPGLNQC